LILLFNPKISQLVATDFGNGRGVFNFYSKGEGLFNGFYQKGSGINVSIILFFKLVLVHF